LRDGVLLGGLVERLDGVAESADTGAENLADDSEGQLVVS
jgi:hypothetical protein